MQLLALSTNPLPLCGRVVSPSQLPFTAPPHKNGRLLARRRHVPASATPPSTNAQQQQQLSPDMFETDLFTRALKGKSFLCTECGKCCTGSGEVWVSTEECERIAGYLSMPIHKFYQMYTKSYFKYNGWRLLKSQKNETLDCIFLKDKLCSIHPVRPRQCSTYPWYVYAAV
mmetsp:Transcript_7528/g.18212  ORF Transcript_7528/g.18212 Transcript_7528/m.18212 type:complete len:171 (+) Transcript_7528:179-691(+)